jgi:hypothetical protein
MLFRNVEKKVLSDERSDAGRADICGITKGIVIWVNRHKYELNFFTLAVN